MRCRPATRRPSAGSPAGSWATSSLSPQIAAHWEDDPDLFARLFPMDLRPQAHDIIRTWLFYTVLRAELQHDSLPWTNAAISGWVLDPDRKKMSKSKGNVVTPMGLLQEHGSDGVRYWAASGRPGTDTAFDTGQMKVGRRLAMKFLNAAKFVLSKSEPQGPITHVLDVGVLNNLQHLVRECTEHFEDYDYAWVLQRVETFFWDFCDNYLELAKARRYGDFGEAGAASANAAMVIALSHLNRLLAPFLPFVTEEVWSWWQQGSVHATAWPTAEEIAVVLPAHGSEAFTQYARVTEVLGEIRKRKAESRLSPAAPLARVVVKNNEQLERWPAEVLADLKAAARADQLVFVADANFAVEIEPAQERSA